MSAEQRLGAAEANLQRVRRALEQLDMSAPHSQRVLNLTGDARRVLGDLRAHYDAERTAALNELEPPPPRAA